MPLMQNVQNRHVHRDRKWVCGCQGLGRGLEATANVDGAYFGGGRIYWN